MICYLLSIYRHFKHDEASIFKDILFYLEMVVKMRAAVITSFKFNSPPSCVDVYCEEFCIPQLQTSLDIGYLKVSLFL